MQAVWLLKGLWHIGIAGEPLRLALPRQLSALHGQFSMDSPPDDATALDAQPGAKKSSYGLEGFPSDHSCLSSSGLCGKGISLRLEKSLPLQNSYRACQSSFCAAMLFY